VVKTTASAARLRPKARILRIIGDELISSERVAVTELVKNAYDADATRVLVRLVPPLEIGKGRIEIIDGGHGMSRETLETAWMEPATLIKKRRGRSEFRKRRMLGEKGVGRFAAAKLGSYLEVVTRRIESPVELRVFFDWSQFDDDTRYLDQVEVLLEETAPREISLGGPIGALWSDDEHPSAEDLTHGTILRMESLRSNWTEEDLRNLHLSLSRLISPFFEEELLREDEFQIRLEVPGPYDALSGPIRPPEALRNPHYTLSGEVNDAGGYELRINLREEPKPVQVNKDKWDHARKPRCGPFRVELRVWDRDQPSIAELARRYDSTISEVRTDLDRAAGISIYRDGFRVLPYGESRNDWLRLDLRRVQNPTMRLSNNQIVGYVLISADQNTELRDQSNREGIIEGPAFEDLQQLVLTVLSELEKRRRSARKAERTRRTERSIFERFDLAPIRRLAEQKHPHDAALLEAIRTTQRELETGVEVFQEVLSRYHRLATLGQLVDVVLHDGRTPLAKIGNEAELGLRDIARSKEATSQLLLRLRERLERIVGQTGVVETVFRRIEPFAGRKRGRPRKVRLEDVIGEAFGVLETEIERTAVRVSLPKTNTDVTVEPAEMEEVIINLLRNSLYWLQSVSKEEREIVVKIRRGSENELSVIFSDSGPGVDPEFRERIFEPYFSTKPDGVGLGLAIAGDIVKDYYNGELELLEKGPLPGATFRITLRRRV